MSEIKDMVPIELQKTLIPEEEQPYEIPGNWKWIKWGVLVNLYSGSGFPTDFQGNSNLPIPFYKVGSLKDIDNNGFLLPPEDTINEEVRNKLKATLVPEGTVLFAKIGEAIRLNRRAILKTPGCIDNNLTGCKPKNDLLDKKYNYYWTIYCDFYQITQATTVPSIRKSTLEGLSFPLPPLNEQKRIVAKLQSLFGKINEAKQLIEGIPETLKQMRQSILAAACSGRLTEDWRERNPNCEPAFNLLKRIQQNKNVKSSEQGEQIDKKKISLPRSWVNTFLGDIVDDFKYGTSEKSDYSYTGLPVIRIPNLQSTKIDLNDLKYLKTNEVIENNKVKNGDILIIRSNGSRDLVGKCALVRNLSGEYAFASYLIRIRPIEVLPEYVLLLLNSEGIKEQFFSKAKSSAGINNINTKELASTKIPLPPIEEQREIVMKVDAIFKLMDEVEIRYQTIVESTDNILQAILNQAFHGELVSQDPNDEPAIKLLERIISGTTDE